MCGDNNKERPYQYNFQLFVRQDFSTMYLIGDYCQIAKKISHFCSDGVYGLDTRMLVIGVKYKGNIDIYSNNCSVWFLKRNAVQFVETMLEYHTFWLVFEKQIYRYLLKK